MIADRIDSQLSFIVIGAWEQTILLKNNLSLFAISLTNIAKFPLFLSRGGHIWHFGIAVS